MRADNLKKTIQKIKDFEMINNGISGALIDVSGIKVTAKKIVCTVTVYGDDFSSRNIYSDVVYPQNLLKNS